MAIKSKTISIGGKTRNVQIGSKADKKYSAMGATEVKGSAGQQAKSERSSYLKSLNTKDSANYVPTPDDAGYEDMDVVNNAVAQGQPIPKGATIPPQSPTPSIIQTGQPSPATVTAGQGLPGAPTTSPGKQAFESSGLATTGAPQDAGAGMTVAKGAMTQFQPQDMSGVDQTLAEDKGWQSMTQMYADYFSPDNQKSSLMDEYKKLYKKSGIGQLDEEIIDAQTIIDGTEDDIRNEVEMAGGFATDSQVQALSLSRNKVLLKNYNQLVALRESKANQLDTMMSFAEKDRAYADSQFDRMLNYQMSMIDYRNKFIQNARDQYNKYDPITLQAMLKNNPRQLAFAEEIMGVGQGGISNMAEAYKQSPAYKLNKAQLYNQELENKKLENELGIGDGVKGTEVGLAKDKQQIETIDALKIDKGLSVAVGPKALFGRGGLKGMFSPGNKQNFIATTEQLISQLTMDSLEEAKKNGATFGALSKDEWQILASTASKIGNWRKTNKEGKVIAYNAKESDFKKEFDVIGNFAKLDYILKGGSPDDVGVITMPDGSLVVENSDGTITQLR